MPHSPFSALKQAEVDFVIPSSTADLPLGIDPFLLYKSRDPAYRKLHETLTSLFNEGMNQVALGNHSEARYLLDFPEPAEIGLGYAKDSKRGSGVGSVLRDLLVSSIEETPELAQRGVRHIEEMQLLSLGIGRDRISDIAANVFKQHLIEYTQKQAEIWGLTLTADVPVHHYFSARDHQWEDGYFDLPVSADNSPVLLVPKRWVRVLPWISFDDFIRSDFSMFLRGSMPGTRRKAKPSKERAVPLTRKRLDQIDGYVRHKEADFAAAQPSPVGDDEDRDCAEARGLITKLKQMPVGAADAHTYQLLVLAILNYLFNPELIDGEIEVRTFDGTERRDIIFTNDSDRSFWDYVRNEHSSILLMFETKNVNDITPANLNQVATYCGDRLGRLAFVVTRDEPTDANLRKAFSIYNDATPRKIILFLSDQNLCDLLLDRCQGRDPMKSVQKMYRKFRQTVQ